MLSTFAFDKPISLIIQALQYTFTNSQATTCMLNGSLEWRYNQKVNKSAGNSLTFLATMKSVTINLLFLYVSQYLVIFLIPYFDFRT